ncbi:MAG: hypothetical protein KVP17_003457 [Porospora cf. gigantea B]|uniref:uncharacterized protein n=1 Tax=Porospora cf. gigantea B TaxID=2853592 RepID=UPI003571C253|nr:MAG: hypothetical protein KVP17_003457 [Porospora cf. gigantea B]
MTSLVRRSFGFFFHAKLVGILAIVFAVALFLVAVALPVVYFSILPGVLQNQVDKADIIVNAAELVSVNDVAAHFLVTATVIRSSSVGSARHYPSTVDVHVSQAGAGKRLLGSLTTPAVDIHEQVTKFHSSVFFQVDEWSVLIDAARKLNSSRPLLTELISYDFKLRSLGRSYSLIFTREFSLFRRSNRRI